MSEKDLLDDVDVTEGSELIVHEVINSKHVDLKEDFISRVKGIISQDHKIKSYSVRDSYGTEIEETELEVGKYTVAIRMTKS
jgi:hypothetical protein